MNLSVHVTLLVCHEGQEEKRYIIEARGGVTTIYAGTGCAIFWGAFSRAEINFGVSFLRKPQVVITFGVSI